MYGIALEAKRRGVKFCISGAGADEIISDYGHLGQRFTPNSNFGGNFPKNLSEVFPWRNFYGGTQRDYLFKEELILVCQGIEGRYPFLDSDCVQAFLNLSSDLKNVEYKAPVANFLRTYSYPFEEGKKHGFSPGKPSGLKRAKNVLLRNLAISRGAKS
jgi:asparagine synthetase B (glutamine-hydrolysing)